jgi:hypothetical protein
MRLRGKKKHLLLTATFLFGFIASARSLENKSRHDAQKAKRCLTQARKQFAGCWTDSTVPICIALHNSELQLQVVLTALDAYCSGSDFSKNKGKCTPPANKTTKTGLAEKLKQALDDLNHNIGTVRGYCEKQLPLMI